MGIGKFFIRKRRDFMMMLHSQSLKVNEAMRALHQFVLDPTKEKSERVIHLEEEADELRRILIDELNKSFVTPIDREDIFILSRTIDDMADYAKSTVEEMLLFNVRVDKHIEKIAEAMCSASKEIAAAISCMMTHHGVCQEHIVRAKKTENFIEHRYREGLAELFKNPDIITIFKTREIYRHLSNAADKADEAADIIGDIVVKKS